MFNYFEYLEKTIEINVCSLTKIITRICNKVLTKLAKSYSKTKKLNNILYNFINILIYRN